MFCSTCGQEQVSASVRFCPRCGSELNPGGEGLAKQLIKMALTLVLISCAIMGWGSFTAGPGYLQVRLLITLIAAIAFYLLFSQDLKHIFAKLFSQPGDQQKGITPADQEFALPPAQSIALPSLASRRVNTADMVPPPSITERTTNLLEKNKD